MDLIRRKQENTVPERTPSGLADRLVWLRDRFGPPNVYGYQDGFTANIEMNTAALGADFKIRTEKHLTPDAAVEQLIERVLAAVASIGR